jgi:glycosyltransferase involved in cell wall biosynthesis
VKVLHVTESRSWSGGTVQLWNLCMALGRRGHEAGLFCPPNAELLKHTPGSGVRVWTRGMRQDYDLPAAWTLAKAVREFKPDVVHAHHPRAHALSLLAGLFAPMPRLVVSRRVSFRFKPWNVFSHLKYRSGRISAYTAVSSDIGKGLVEQGVRADKVHVIHSGVDVKKFSPRPPSAEVRAALKLPAGVPVVGNLNHFSWWKGQTVFLEAAKVLSETPGAPKAHFLLAGKDTDGPEAREKVRSLGLEDRVTLAGFRTDMPEVISVLSLTVLSSLAGEGFSGVLREAMSMGVPVAATDVGGNRELVEDGVTGLLVPAGDAKVLAAAMGRALSAPDQARAWSAEAQRRVRSSYSIEAMVDKTIALYESLLPGAGRSRPS